MTLTKKLFFVTMQVLFTLLFTLFVFSNTALAQDCTDVNDPRCGGGSTYTPTNPTPSSPSPTGDCIDRNDPRCGGGSTYIPSGGPTFSNPTFDEPTAVDPNDNNNPEGGPGDTSIELFDPVNMSIEEIFLSILDIITVFAIPIILFFIVWAGFLYVTAAGDASKVQKATVALTYAVVGALLVLGARILLAVITNTINTFTL